MSSYVTTEPDGSRDVDVQSLFCDQIDLVRRIARMGIDSEFNACQHKAECVEYAAQAGATLGKLHAAQKRIAELEAERDRLRTALASIHLEASDDGPDKTVGEQLYNCRKIARAALESGDE